MNANDNPEAFSSSMWRSTYGGLELPGAERLEDANRVVMALIRMYNDHGAEWAEYSDKLNTAH